MTTAATLGRFGFQVRLHERANGLRELGAGIYLKENSIRVLDGLGVYAPLEERAVRLREMRIRTEGGRMILRRDVSAERTLVALREHLHGVLLDAARSAGAEILTGSRVESASPDGTIVLQGGRQVERADLLIGADGLHSRVRATAGFEARVKTLADGATRLLIPRTETEPVSTEHWSRRLRVGVTPCSPDSTYVFLIAPANDHHASAVPVDVEYWLRHFPYLADVFERVPGEQAVHHPHALVLCPRWVRGRVALVGDAAHAQPPNLGQGAGLAIANAWALASAQAGASDVQTGLARWEGGSRRVGQAVQRWSHRYGLAGYRWPMRLLRLRSATLWALGHFRPTRHRWVWLWRGGISGRDQAVT
jgi:2-polyprenyl-6-methoxyphenol hydroxylase-like FAD-dependent oxidoreductase